MTERNIDDRVRNVLNLISNVQPSGVPEDALEKSNGDPEVKRILREAAFSAVVLERTYAVISGGGSAGLRPSYTVTPFDAIAEAARELGINEVQFAGTAHKYAPVIASLGLGQRKDIILYCPKHARARISGQPTVRLESIFFQRGLVGGSSGQPGISTTTDTFMIDNLSSRIINSRFAGWKLKFTLEATSEASPSSTLQRPPKELEGFTKTAVLQPRGSEDVCIGLAFGFFNDQEDMNRWVAEEDELKVFVGPTLDDVQASFSLELTETFSWI